MKKAFDEYMEQQSDTNRLKNFFADFDAHCLLNKAEKEKLREDFEKALLYYTTIGISQEKALELLNIKNLGGFYARPAGIWFALDDAAKIYPLSMQQGRMSVFRLSVYIKEAVVPELLQMALNFTVKRFPSFATTLKKGFFWHYLDMTKRRFYIEPEIDIPCQPIKVSRSGSQSFRVLYYMNRISVEFFHVLSDGMGAVTFLKSLVAEYLRLAGKDIVLEETLLDINAIPTNEEFENAFEKVPRKESGYSVALKTAIQMGGKLAKTKPCRIVHLKMKADELKAVSEKYQTTVTGYLLALMFIAGKAATDELKGNMNIQLPVNLRKFYPSKTIRNFVLHCGICIPIEMANDVKSIIKEINNQLDKKASKEAMSEILASTVKMVETVKYIPLAIKQPAARVGYGFLGDTVFTSILSNLGVVKMPPSAAAYIESMDAVIGTAITHRARCTVLTFHNTATFSITKATLDPTFEEKMYELLCSDGIAVTVEGSEIYEN